MVWIPWVCMLRSWWMEERGGVWIPSGAGHGAAVAHVAMLDSCHFGRDDCAELEVVGGLRDFSTLLLVSPMQSLI